MSTEIAKFSDWLTSNGDRVQREMPTGYSIEKIKRLALHLQASSPQLKSCTPQSLFLGIMKAAHLDLSIDLGEAHLVPYGRECNFQIDYKGLIKLAKRSGQVKHVKADVVREGDLIAYARSTTPGESYLQHDPLPFNAAPIVGAYALFYLTDGSTEFEILTPADAKAIRAKAAKGSMMWQDFESEAWKKAVIRRGLKTLELMPEDKRALDEDDRQGYDFAQPKPVVATLNQRFAPKPAQPQLEAEPVDVDSDEVVV
jgi:recombination protein RecT